MKRWLYRPLKEDLPLLTLMALVGAVFALAIGQYALIQISRVQLNSYTSALLKQTTIAASLSMDTFAVVEKGTEPMCSDANLSEMRYLAFTRRWLYDIGRVRDGKLVCTAGWGRFKTPLQLPSPQVHEANGNLIWTQIDSVTDHRLQVNMFSRGSVIVFASATPPVGYEKFDPTFSALILTRDGQHTYWSLGDTRAALWHFQHGTPASISPFRTRLFSTGCADRFDACAVATLSNVNFPARSPVTALEVTGIGSLSASIFGLMTVRRRRRQSVPVEQLRRAIAGDRIGLAYQPLVRIQDERMIGVEALLRTTDDDGRPIPADIVIGIAEQSGLISKITRIVVHKALCDMRKRLTGEDAFYLSLNVSMQDVTDPAFQQYLDEETDRLQIPRHRIVLELTERSTTDGERLLSAAIRLRKNGYGLYIDDLGTGYSTLAYLSKLPITGIKVDRIFTQSIGKEAISSTIVEKICSIAEYLNVTIVLEGVETQEQAAHIRELHPAAIGQGFFWSKAVSAELLDSVEEALGVDQSASDLVHG